MATTHLQIAAPPDRVFAILCDPWTYADWVVGAHSIRAADETWPEVGARFHHRVGVRPLTVEDYTEVLDVDEPSRLDLRARARPLGTARVTMLLSPHAGGTAVTMIETAGSRLARISINALTDPILHLRNALALRRLRRIAETGVLKS